MNANFRGWVANLSNGTVTYEGQPIPGERTPWQQLLAYCREKDLQITGLRLHRGGVTLHAMTYRACQGYYQAYEYRKSAITNAESLRQGIGSVVGDGIVINWVDDQGHVWTDIRPLKSEIIHTTLQT